MTKSHIFSSAALFIVLNVHKCLLDAKANFCAESRNESLRLRLCLASAGTAKTNKKLHNKKKRANRRRTRWGRIIQRNLIISGIDSKGSR